MPCPDRLSRWKQEVSTAFPHLSKPQMWGLVLWSAGIALSGAAGITQISASRRVGAGTTRTSGVSTLARVVSGCEAQKREKAAGTGCDLVLCAFVAVDRANDGETGTNKWCWSWMRPHEESAGRFYPSAWSCASVRSRWRGRSWEDMRKGRSDRIGKACSRI